MGGVKTNRKSLLEIVGGEKSSIAGPRDKRHHRPVHAVKETNIFRKCTLRDIFQLRPSGAARRRARRVVTLDYALRGV